MWFNAFSDDDDQLNEDYEEQILKENNVHVNGKIMEDFQNKEIERN